MSFRRSSLRAVRIKLQSSHVQIVTIVSDIRPIAFIKASAAPIVFRIVWLSLAMANDAIAEDLAATGVHRRHAQLEAATEHSSQDAAVPNATRRRSAATRSVRKDRGGGSGEVGHGKLIKYGSLLLLILQMVGLVLLMRYSRTTSSGDELYVSSTAVATMELMKFIICLGVVGTQAGSMDELVKQLRQHILHSPGELL